MKNKNLHHAIEVLIGKLDSINKILECKFKKELGNLDPKITNAEFEKLKSIKISTPTDWLKYEELFEEFFPNYFHNITEKYSKNLSESEFRLFLILKSNRSYFSIGEQLGISKESVRVAIYRLRRKLKLKSNIELFKTIDLIKD